MKKYLSKVATSALTLTMMASMVLPVHAANPELRYVDVTADVNATLSFEIVETNNILAPTSTCALGTLDKTQQSTCDYRLRISSTFSGGWVADLWSNHAFRHNTSLVAFGDVTDGTVSPGSEEYGLAITPATNGGYISAGVYTGTPTVAGAYSATDHLVPVATSTSVLSYANAYDGWNGGAAWATSTTDTITHKASINNATPAGNYSHRVYWQVTASL